MDPDYEQNEDKYKGIKAELLGENSDGEESGSGSDSDESDSEDEKGRVIYVYRSNSLSSYL